MRLRQALILAINTSILAVLFVFMGWLYWTSRGDVEREAAASIARAAKITGDLAAMRERELSGLARSLASAPMLRGALGTRDRETINDVLAAAAAKNGLLAVEIRRGGAAQFGVPPRGWTALTGEADAGGGLTLRLTQAPDVELLRSWTAITGAFYAIRSAAGTPIVADLPEGEDPQALRVQPSRGSAPIVVSGKSSYCAAQAVLLGGRLTGTLFEPRDPFWKAFERRRNSLIVLGAALFFMGLLLSIGFAEAVERFSRAGGSGRSEDWQALLDEIEAQRARAPR
jgi:hypothetical protein